MGTSGKKLLAALEKARGVGIVEETFTVEDCELTLRSLRPDEYEEVLAECKELDDLPYVNAFQKGHIVRSIVGINGNDLHEVEFVDEEITDPKTKQVKTVGIELHAWLRKNIIDTWGKEVVFTTYRKFTDVVQKAEDQSKKGITFFVPDETPDERYRRLLAEAKELETEIPPEMSDHILEQMGYQRRSTPEELAAAEERLKGVKDEGGDGNTPPAAAAPPASPPPATPPPVPVAAAPTPEPEPAPIVFTRPPARQPLNQVPVALPDPPAPQQQPVEQSVPFRRSPTITSLDLMEPGELPPTGPVQVPPSVSAAEVFAGRKHPPPNPQEVAKIIDRPPQGGLNPKYRPPQR